MTEVLPAEVVDVLALSDFAPSATVDTVMGRLVEYVIDPDRVVDPAPSAAILERVQMVCAATETELEVFWAQRIISADAPTEVAADFPYLDNYTDLVLQELELVAATGLRIDSTHRVLVIGSGPLPLTGIHLELMTGASVEMLDQSPLAAELSIRVGEALGLPVRVLVGAGERIELEGSYDLVLIAALAGRTVSEKQAIIDNVRTWLSPQGRLIVRTARGRRALLYPAFESDALTGLKLLNEHHPNDHIINSAFIYKPLP